jgi:excisionase family DNA binding protein
MPVEDRIAVDVETAAEMLGISRGALYPLVMSGDVPSFKIGRRRLVLLESLREWAATQAHDEGKAS